MTSKKVTQYPVRTALTGDEVLYMAAEGKDWQADPDLIVSKASENLAETAASAGALAGASAAAPAVAAASMKAAEASGSATIAQTARNEAIDAAADAQSAAGATFFATKAAMDATSPQPANSRAVVNRDPVIANNGHYTSNGTSFVLDTLQPASTAAVIDLQALIAPGNSVFGYALKFWDKRRWGIGGIDFLGGLRTALFYLRSAPVAQGFVVQDKRRYRLLDSSRQLDPSINLYPSRGGIYHLFGDSITETDNPSAGRFGLGPRTNWPLFFASITKPKSIRNHATAGASFREYVGQTTWQKIRTQVNSSLGSGETPDCVIVALGTNDKMDNLGSYADAMAFATLVDLEGAMGTTANAARWTFWTLQQAYPKAKMFCSLPIQRTDFTTVQMQPLLDVITALAKEYGFVVIDAMHESGINRQFEPGRDLLNEPPGPYLHPNTNGSMKLANTIAVHVLQNLPRVR